MKSTVMTSQCITPDSARAAPSSSHLRKRRRSNARRALPAVAPRLADAPDAALTLSDARAATPRLTAALDSALSLIEALDAALALTDALNGAPRLAAPLAASARPTAVEVRCLDAVELHDPDGNFRTGKVPQVLHIDADIKSATVLAALLMPEARVTHAASLAQARELLASQIYSLVVLDPQLPDGDVAALMPLLQATPLLVYASRHPEWRVAAGAFLPKPWTTPRQLWSTVSSMLGIASNVTAGD